MSKRKTKQQKMIADLKRKIQSKESVSPSQTSASPVHGTTTFTFSAPKNTTSYTPRVQSHALYALPFADLKKTAIVTSTVLIAQVILFFLLRHHIITLPMVNY